MAYLDCAKKYNANELQAIAEIIGELVVLLSACTRNGGFDDYIGKVYMNLELGNKATGQFFTPYSVSYLLAQMSIGKIPDADILTVADSCVGAGGMLLAAADVFNRQGVNYAERMLAYGCDVDLKCVMMSYLQLAWAGIPAIIYHGNTLTQEMWDVWETPAYLFNKMHFQSALRQIRGEKANNELRPIIGPVFYFNKEAV